MLNSPRDPWIRSHYRKRYRQPYGGCGCGSTLSISLLLMGICSLFFLLTGSLVF